MRYTGPFTLEEATEREWLLANGLGGYASSTLCGMQTRRYHGLLVAALHPPGGRTLLVSKLDEEITLDGRSYPLATNEYPGTIHPRGFEALREFELTGDAVIMRFAAGGAELEKCVWVTPGENTTRVRYRNTGQLPYPLTVTALVNARDFHGETSAESIHFDITATRAPAGPVVQVCPWWMAEGFWLTADAGEWEEAKYWFYQMTYCWERRRGLQDHDNHFSPGRFHCALQPGETITVTLSTLPPAEQSPCAAPCLEGCERSEPRPLPSADPSPADPPEIAHLYHTAASFLVQRATVGAQHVAGRTIIAGYHWFGDWGRDTMIALPGLCLLTGRYDEAAEILRTFAAARRRGLLPNLFLDSGEGEAYNTVDAALWFIDAVDRTYRATGNRALVEELRPALEEIIHYYRTGTDFGIRMADDGLIDASSPGWQLTWMDAKVGDWVVTPRMGKPVEINALWYNALRIMEAFASDFGWPGDFGALADRVRASYDAYWVPGGGYLYDVLAAQPDARLRPNQIFAVSLRHSPLSDHRARAVVDVVEKYLLTPYGLRSLAPSDPEYRPHYGGNTWERDGAYHQGTVWGWLIGPYMDAFLRVNGYSNDAKARGRELLQPLLAHVHEAGIGSISEIFDADPPHAPRGTISQAWSVAECLRAWESCRE